MAGVHITDGEEARPGILKMFPAHTADANNGLGQFVTRCDMSPAAENTAGDDHEEARSQSGTPNELAP
jgi:hypothetical protein